MRRYARRHFGTGLINAKDEVMALSVYGIGATRDRRHRDVAAGGGHDHDGSDIALLKRARHRRPPFFIYMVLGRFAHLDLIWPAEAEPGVQRATVTCVQTARCIDLPHARRGDAATQLTKLELCRGLWRWMAVNIISNDSKVWPTPDPPK